MRILHKQQNHRKAYSYFLHREDILVPDNICNDI